MHKLITQEDTKGKTYRHDITEILLKMTLNIINQPNQDIKPTHTSSGLTEDAEVIS
jgi:hypothetical protein